MVVHIISGDLHVFRQLSLGDASFVAEPDEIGTADVVGAECSFEFEHNITSKGVVRNETSMGRFGGKLPL